MESWILGERKYVYEEVSVSGADYEVFDVSDESVVDSGSATVGADTIYFLWEPINIGKYVVRFSYTSGDELCKSDQVIRVKETM